MSEVGDNIYIADLPGEVDETLIRTIFGAYGTVASCKAMQAKFPGQRGAALVRFSSADEAAWVVNNLNGNIAEGLLEPIRVKFANQGTRPGANATAAGGGAPAAWNPAAAAAGKVSAPPLSFARSAPYGGGGGGGASAPGGPQQPSDNVYIGDLPGDVDDQLVKTVFGAYGLVMSCKAMQAKFPGQKGAALIRFSSVEEASWLVKNLNGNVAEGLMEPVQVRFAKPSSGKGGGGFPPPGAAPGAAPFGGGAPGDAGGWPADGGLGGWTAGYDAAGYGAAGFDASAVGLGGVPQAGGLAVPHVGAAGAGAGTLAAAVAGMAGAQAMFQQAPPTGGAPGGKGNGKGQPVSNSDINMVVSGLLKQLPGSDRKKPEDNCLYVGGLPANTTDLDLYKMFGCFGSIPATGITAKMLEDGTCAGCGWIDFNDPASAQAAAEMLHGLVLPDGTVLRVMKKRPKGSQGQGGGQW